MRLPLSVSPALSLAFSAASVFAAGEFHLPHQAGLFSEPGHRLGSTRLEAFTESGWLAGYSNIGPVRAAWITDTAARVTHRVGVFTGAEFQNDYGTTISGLTEGGWVWGYSVYSPTPLDRPAVLWVADGSTGVTTPVTGLTGPEFTSSSGIQVRAIREVTANGLAWGVSQRYSGAFLLDQAPWVMNCRTGAVAPAGLFDDPAYTGPDGARGNSGYVFTEGGWLYGKAVRYGPAGGTGSSVWVADAATGVTRRAGLFSGGEFARSTGEQESFIGRTAGGFMAGTSTRYPGPGYGGRAAWVTDAAAGATRRIGFFGPAQTESPHGIQFSTAEFLTKSGLVAGTSSEYPGGKAAGHSAWVADARTGATTRVGFFRGERNTIPGTDDPEFLTESGWIVGSTVRKGGGVDRALWVADAATGAVRNVGPSGGVYAHADGWEYPFLLGVTESGWVTGRSQAFRRETGPAGEYGASPEAYWVADARTGAHRRMGLAGGEFVSSAGRSGGTLKAVTEAGKVYGYSWTYRGADTSGTAAWVGDAATGSVFRIGLSGGEFLSEGEFTQSTELGGWTESGFVNGASFSFAAGNAGGSVPWVADVNTGRTWRCGIPGGIESKNTYLSEGGLQAGFTRMPAENSEPTAWVMNAKTGVQTVFDLDRNPETGRAGSAVGGITSHGIVYGFYLSFRNMAVGAYRAFLWAEGLGTLLSGEPAPPGEAAVGYRWLRYIHVTGNGVAFSQAVTRSAAGMDELGNGVFYGKVADLAGPGGGGGARVTDLARLPDGKHRLSFHTDSPMRVTLQSSADLSTWRDAQTVDAPAGASHMDIAPDPAAGPNCYWRLKIESVSP